MDRTLSSKLMITGTVSLAAVIIFNVLIFQYAQLYQAIVPQKVSAQPATNNNFLTYNNPTYKIKMQYPADWTVSTNTLQTYSGVVAFYSPLQSLTDILPAELSLSITTYSQGVSLDEYTKTTLAALDQQGIKVSDSNAFTLAGKPGHRIVFSPPQPQPQNNNQGDPQVSISIMQAWTTIGNKVYLISYSAEESKFQKYLPTVEQMLSSLQI
jgi:eukaryotic-like serine/threonine-protein kinase